MRRCDKCRGQNFIMTADGKGGMPCGACDGGRALKKRIDDRPTNVQKMDRPLNICRDPMNWKPPTGEAPATEERPF